MGVVKRNGKYRLKKKKDVWEVRDFKEAKKEFQNIVEERERGIF